MRKRAYLAAAEGRRYPTATAAATVDPRSGPSSSWIQSWGSS